MLMEALDFDDVDSVRLVIEALLDISGAQRHPGRRTLWAWLAEWCAGASAEHRVTAARIVKFTRLWHECYERQSSYVWLGLVPATEDELAQIGTDESPLRERRSVRAARSATTPAMCSSWLADGEARFEREVVKHFGSPETIAGGGMIAANRGDVAASLFFFQKAIDLLHTLYISSQMSTRQPGPRDDVIIGRYLETLRGIRTAQPNGDVSLSVKEVTHRLRTISTTCEDAGLNPGLYLTALAELAAIAPDVDVSDVLWRRPSLGDMDWR